jgi:hypothetical protein
VLLGVPISLAAGATAGILNTVDFSGTIGLGSIIVALVVTIVAGLANLRNRLYRDQVEGWRGNYLQEKEHAALLDQRLEDSHELIGKLRAEIAECRIVIEKFEQLPNLERLIRLMSDIQERQEKRAQDRHVEVMAAIAATTR